MTQAQLTALAKEICDKAPHFDQYQVRKSIETQMAQYLHDDGCGEALELFAKALERAHK